MIENQLKIMTIFFIIITIISCKSGEFQDTDVPYKVGQSYVFKTTVIESNSTIIIDTLTLTIKKKGMLGSILGMNMVEWKSKKFPAIEEIRGINLEPYSAEIQMPLNYPHLENENLVIVGYPSFSRSMLVGSTSKSNHLFPKSYGKLADKEIIQESIVVDSVQIDFKGKNIDVQVVEYVNSSHIEKFGAYELTTFYNSEFGFVKMKYIYPNQKQIKFELIEVNNEP